MMRREALLRLRARRRLGRGLQDPARPVRHLADAAALPRAAVYQFRNRLAGESKLDTNVAWEYFIMLLDRFLGRRGADPLHRLLAGRRARAGGPPARAERAVQGRRHVVPVRPRRGATMVAMTSNFVLNNVLTYRDMRLRGWGCCAAGSRSCSPAASARFANVGIAAYLFEQQDSFWVVVGHRRRAGRRRLELRGHRGLHLEDAEERVAMASAASAAADSALARCRCTSPR